MLLYKNESVKFLWDESLEVYEVRDSDGDYVFLDKEEMEELVKAYQQHKEDIKNGKD